VVVDGFTFTGQTQGVVQGAAVTTLAGGTQAINDIFSQNIIGFYPNSFLSGASPLQTLVRHDLFDSNNQPGPASGVGVYSDLGLENLLVSENLFRNNESNSVTVDGSGTTHAVGDITVSDNVADSGIFLFTVAGATVSGNQIVSPLAAAGGYGLDLFGAVSDVSVTGNWFVNGSRGVILRANTPNSGVTLSGNCIAQNSTAGLLVDPGSSSDPVEASGNWWGSTNGASGTGSGFGDAWIDPDGLISSSSDLTAPTAAPCPQLPTISMTAPTKLEGNAGTTAFTFTVRLSAPYYVQTQFDWATGGGTATPGVDYQDVSGTITIPAGETSATITVLVNGDTTPEPDETFKVTLSNVINALPTTLTATATIVDDDSLPSTGPGGNGNNGNGFPLGGVQTGGWPLAARSSLAVATPAEPLGDRWLAGLAVVAFGAAGLLVRGPVRGSARVPLIVGPAGALALLIAAQTTVNEEAAAASPLTSLQPLRLQWAYAPRSAEPRPAVAPRPAPAEMRVVIPAIGVNAPVISLGLNPDRTLQVPDSGVEAGWWSGGTRPGRAGPAVIVGHINWAGRPGVFGHLNRLSSGDLIVIHGFGLPIRYRVWVSGTYPKAGFPTGLVYGGTPRSTLRLITCAGRFDPTTGHYTDNLIVLARRV